MLRSWATARNGGHHAITILCLKERSSWGDAWRNGRVRRVAGWTDQQECSLQMGCAGSSRRRAVRYIHMTRGGSKWRRT